MTKTKIEWATDSWNPIKLAGGGYGCAKVSPGCDNCYAERMSARFWKTPPFDGRQRKFVIDQKTYDQPKRWKKRRMVFVCSMMDLFHHDVRGDMITMVFYVMRLHQQHIFMVLTKRPEQMKLFVPSDNIWLGVSAENQKWAQKRIPILLDTPAKVRFVSYEPALGNISADMFKGLDWVIFGCESGANKRRCDLGWAREMIAGCREYGAAPFVKQLPINGRVSHDMSEWPEDLRIREYPKET